jgi:DNA-binding MarR family transcriptional regulator
MSGQRTGQPATRRYGVPARADLRDSVDRLLAEWADERPDLDFAPVGVVTRMARVRAHLDAGVTEVFRRFDLTSPDFQVIVTLRRAGRPYRMTQARLMTELALTSGTVSVRVDRLVRRGVVARESDAEDRRTVRVRLTEEGLALFDEIAPLHLANEDRLLSALTADEQAQLGDLLRRLLVSFESGGVAVGQPWGMRLEPAHLARARRAAVGLSDTAGLLVAETIAGTPAAEAGLARGDLLVAVDGHEVRSDATLAVLVEMAGPGARLTIDVLRGDEPLTLSLTIPR